MSDLNQYKRHCHTQSLINGWWPKDTDEYDLELCAAKIALIHSEVSEMLEGLRTDSLDDHLPNRKTEEVEAADILIRLFDYAGARGLDLEGAFQEKLLYNDKREDHKPERRNIVGGKKI